MLRALVFSTALCAATLTYAHGPYAESFSDFGGFSSFRDSERQISSEFFQEPDQFFVRPRVVYDQFRVPGRAFVRERFERVREVQRQFYQDDFRIQPFPYQRQFRAPCFRGGCGDGGFGRGGGLLDLEVGVGLGIGRRGGLLSGIFGRRY